jgi:hypothetical protein
MKKAKELYDYLLEDYNCMEKDLKLCEPESGQTDWNGKEYLADEYCVCCEQKLIYWDNDGYLIICLYDSIPNMKYDTIVDVADFLRGACHYEGSGLFYPKEGETSLESKAYYDGVFTWMYEQMNHSIKEFSKNALINPSDKPINFGDLSSSKKIRSLTIQE